MDANARYLPGKGVEDDALRAQPTMREARAQRAARSPVASRDNPTNVFEATPGTVTIKVEDVATTIDAAIQLLTESGEKVGSQESSSELQQQGRERDGDPHDRRDWSALSAGRHFGRGRPPPVR